MIVPMDNTTDQTIDLGDLPADVEQLIAEALGVDVADIHIEP